MKFITNKISTGKAKSFDDIIKEYQKSKMKVASSTATVKTAEQDEADSSGQLDVEPLHQTGESTTMPKAGPSAKTEGKDNEKAAKADTCPEKEGDDSEQPKWEGKQENNNKPEVLEDAKGGSANAKTKEAALEDLPQAVQDKIKGKKTDDACDDDDKNDKDDKDCSAEKNEEDEEKKESEVKDEDEEKKEAGCECEKCNCDPCECKDSKCAEKEEEDEEKKEASSTKFVKIANLNAKNKGFIREYWTKLYGEDSVSALLADK